MKHSDVEELARKAGISFSQADHDFDKMRENGATAWAGVDAQALRAGHLTQQVEPVRAGELPPLPEPDSYLFQHDETGNTMFVDAQQVEWGFEKNNPRLHKIGGAFTEGQMHAYARAALSARKPLTPEQRAKVFRDAETRMVYDLNLSWRNAVIDEVERAHGIGLEVKP